MKCPVNKMPIAEHIVQSEMLSSGEPFQLLLLIEMSDLLRLDPCLCIAVVDTRGKRTRGLGMSWGSLWLLISRTEDRFIFTLKGKKKFLRKCAFSGTPVGSMKVL